MLGVAVEKIEEYAIEIVDAQPLGDYRLSLLFSDGTKRVIDFGPFLKKATHTDIRKYLDPQLFAGFSIEGGDLVWNDYELCFPLKELYDGNFYAKG